MEFANRIDWETIQILEEEIKLKRNFGKFQLVYVNLTNDGYIEGFGVVKNLLMMKIKQP